MVKYRVQETTVIDVPKEQVYEYLINLHLWNTWSPWSCLDPSVKQEISADNNTLSWDSQIIGSGRMTAISATDTHINGEIEFFKPFKSHAQVGYIIDKLTDKQTRVTWTMDSQLPWYMFFLKKLMIAMIGKDYRRGLNRLKLLCETGAVRSRIEFFDEPIMVDAVKFAGMKSHSHMDDLASSMTKAYEIVTIELAKQHSIELGYGCTFCDKLSFIKNTMDYTAGFYYVGEIGVTNLTQKSIPKHKAIKVRLIGRYEYLADAWTAIAMHVRASKLKSNKSIAPYEVYIKGPHNTDNQDEYVTDIYMPVH